MVIPSVVYLISCRDNILYLAWYFYRFFSYSICKGYTRLSLSRGSVTVHSVFTSSDRVYSKTFRLVPIFHGIKYMSYSFIVTYIFFSRSCRVS